MMANDRPSSSSSSSDGQESHETHHRSGDLHRMKRQMKQVFGEMLISYTDQILDAVLDHVLPMVNELMDVDRNLSQQQQQPRRENEEQPQGSPECRQHLQPSPNEPENISNKAPDQSLAPNDAQDSSSINGDNSFEENVQPSTSKESNNLDIETAFFLFDKTRFSASTPRDDQDSFTNGDVSFESTSSSSSSSSIETDNSFKEEEHQQPRSSRRRDRENHPILRRELAMNGAIFSIYDHGPAAVLENRYLLVDVVQQKNNNNNHHHNHINKRPIADNNKINYKIYNVMSSRQRLKECHRQLEDFADRLLFPSQFTARSTDIYSFTAHERVLAITSKGASLLPARVLGHENTQVEVLFDTGERALLPQVDVFRFRDGGRVLGPAPANVMSEIIEHRPADDSQVSKLMIKYAKFVNKDKEAPGHDRPLEGIWRWTEPICSNSRFMETRRNGSNSTVIADTYRAVWKNGIECFRVGDNVQIWDDYADDTPEKPIFPNFGKIKRIYREVSTGRHRVQFTWYDHTYSYQDHDSPVRNIPNALILSNDYDTTDVDYIQTHIRVLSLSKFVDRHPRHEFNLVDQFIQCNDLANHIRSYCYSLRRSPSVRDYFLLPFNCERKEWTKDPVQLALIGRLNLANGHQQQQQQSSPSPPEDGESPNKRRRLE